MINEESDFRWNDYFLCKGDDFENFWKRFLKEKKSVLFILGCGFDPRMCEGISKLLDSNSSSSFHCLAIDYREGPGSPSEAHGKEKTNNIKLLNEICTGKSQLEYKELKLRDQGGELDIRKITKVFSEIDEFKSYSDIVLDISALPLFVYFPLIAKILNILDNESSKNTSSLPNLHIIVSENTRIDECIIQQELDDEAILLYPFKANLDEEGYEKVPKVWIPVLGENNGEQMEKISTLIKPDEISPILPALSSNPRRGDDIFLKYENFFKRAFIEPTNIIHGTEQNPFEVYREILRTVIRYRKSLLPLGTCKIALSALSSKLLSIAVFLSAYEAKANLMNIGIAQVFSKGFIMKENCISEEIKSENKLFSLWIFGDCYSC